jgi:hypothetical protein
VGVSSKQEARHQEASSVGCWGVVDAAPWGKCSWVLLDGVARGAEALRERLSVSSLRKAANGKQAGLAAGEGWGLHLEKKGVGRSVDGAARGAEALRERVSVSSKQAG